MRAYVSREVTQSERKVPFADVAGVREAVLELGEIKEFLLHGAGPRVAALASSTA